MDEPNPRAGSLLAKLMLQTVPVPVMPDPVPDPRAAFIRAVDNALIGAMQAGAIQSRLLGIMLVLNQVGFADHTVEEIEAARYAAVELWAALEDLQARGLDVFTCVSEMFP